jgi:Eukaryotic aspartyl protease
VPSCEKSSWTSPRRCNSLRKTWNSVDPTFRQRNLQRFSDQKPLWKGYQLENNEALYMLLFTANISLGTPRQEFLANVDLSWSDLFVPSVNCSLDPKLAPYCAPRRKYNSTASSTYEAHNETAKVQYKGIFSEGQVAEDTLQIGELAIKSQRFEDATRWATIYPPWWSVLDSALGLARLRPNDSESTLDVNSPMQNIINRGLLSRNVFTLKLPRTDEELGELVMGDIDAAYAQPMITIPVTNVSGGPYSPFAGLASTGWQVNMSAMSLGSTSETKHNLTLSLEGCTAIITNTFEYISLPGSRAKQIMQHLGLDLYHSHVSCDRRADLPDVTLFFGSHGSLTLNASQYLVEVEDTQDGKICVVPFNNWYQYDLGGPSPDFILLGTAFLSGLYSLFDLENATISCKCFHGAHTHFVKPFGSENSVLIFLQ